MIAVKSSAWIQELSLMRDEIKKRLNQALGPGVIQELRFKIGAWEDESVPVEEAGPGERPADLGPALVEEARNAARVIPDPRLREQVIQALLASAKRGAGDQDDPDE